MRAPQTRVSDGHDVAGEPTCLMFDGPSPTQTESAYSLLPGNPHSRDAPLSLSNYYCSLIVALRYSPPLASCTARPKNYLFLGLPAPPNSCSQVSSCLEFSPRSPEYGITWQMLKSRMPRKQTFQQVPFLFRRLWLEFSPRRLMRRYH